MSKASTHGNVLVNKAAAPSLLPLLNSLRRRGFNVIESKTLAVTLLFPKTKQAFLVATHDFTPVRVPFSSVLLLPWTPPPHTLPSVATAELLLLAFGRHSTNACACTHAPEG